MVPRSEALLAVLLVSCPKIGWWARGPGWCLRHVGIDAVVLVHGTRVFFDHGVCSCYAWIMSGEWNESETHEPLRVMGHAVDASLHFEYAAGGICEMGEGAFLAHQGGFIGFDCSAFRKLCARRSQAWRRSDVAAW